MLQAWFGADQRGRGGLTNVRVCARASGGGCNGAGERSRGDKVWRRELLGLGAGASMRGPTAVRQLKFPPRDPRRLELEPALGTHGWMGAR